MTSPTYMAFGFDPLDLYGDLIYGGLVASVITLILAPFFSLKKSEPIKPAHQEEPAPDTSSEMRYRASRRFERMNGTVLALLKVLPNLHVIAVFSALYGLMGTLAHLALPLLHDRLGNRMHPENEFLLIMVASFAGAYAASARYRRLVIRFFQSIHCEAGPAEKNFEAALGYLVLAITLERTGKVRMDNDPLNTYHAASLTGDPIPAGSRVIVQGMSHRAVDGLSARVLVVSPFGN
jgi:hypothetical protein